MKYGFERGWDREVGFHWGILDKQIQRGMRPNIIIGDTKTWRFEGHKTSILRFLLDKPTHLFSSHTQYLFLKGGTALKNPGEVVGSKLGGLVLGGGGEHLAAQLVDLTHSGLEFATKAFGAGVGEIKKPGKAANFFDKWVGDAIIVTLSAMSPPQTSKYDKVYKLSQSVTFATLAEYISEHF